MLTPDFKTFRELAREGNLVAVTREILADVETPVSAYIKIAARARQAFLLESAENEKNLGRYSFIGIDPLLMFESYGPRVSITRDGKTKIKNVKDPLREFEKTLAGFRLACPETQAPMTAGAVGYMGYGMVKDFENIPQNRPETLGFPDLHFIMPRTLIVFDHFNHRMKVVSLALIEKKADLRQLYFGACARIDAVVDMLKKNLTMAPFEPGPDRGVSKPYQSNCTKAEFTAMVKKAKEYICAGDVFQVVPSQRLSMETTASGFDIYRALRSVNPSPYMFYIRMNQHALIGSSPEIFVRCDKNGHVTTRPIAGTRKRGATAEEDAALEKSLLADEKEKAEHLMLVDLARNDIGRVCKMGSVRVDEFMTVERYSHVMHLVSNVVGELGRGKTPFDLVRACFPVGTMTGAPKVRAMQIIEELEKNHRGPYAGAVCYFSLSGEFDSCITIRTLLMREDLVTIQAGAGVVYDSNPDAEYEETLNKARGMLKAVEMAEAFKSRSKEEEARG